tara:strand:- start:307 stop:612 length:306 start_codon:yes stop_codon:yes gene_type:complete
MVFIHSDKPKKHTLIQIPAFSPNCMEEGCNIGAKGRAIRLFGGIASVIGGFLLLALILTGYIESSLWWPPTVGSIALGSLGIYEGRTGWCYVRGMGIWTPL